MSFFTSGYINSSIARLATRYVGQYLDGIEPDKFEVAWKAGNLQLNDVRIRQEVVDLVGQPVSLAYGWVGRVKVSLPIGNLFSLRGGSATSSSQPLIIELEELYLVLVPKPDEEWDDKDFIDRHKLSRQRMLDEADVRLLAVQAQRQLEKAAVQGKKRGWMAKFASRFVEDIQFKIRGVHIRYEDAYGSPAGRFCMGVTLENLSIKTPSAKDILKAKHSTPAASTTRADNKDTTTKGQRKILRIDEIAVYWNSHFTNGVLITESIKDDSLEEADDLIKTFMKNFRTYSPNGCPMNQQNFILKPFSCSVFVQATVGKKSKCWRPPPQDERSNNLSCLTVATPSGESHLSPEDQSRTTASQYTIDVELASLDVSIHKELFRDLSSLASTVRIYKALASSVTDRFELYHPYRPELPVKGHAKIWWKYSVSCVLRRLKEQFPEAFEGRKPIWEWGEHLKEARVLYWKEEYYNLLVQSFNEVDGSSPRQRDPKLKEELDRYQQVLPKQELLEVYVEAKQTFLGLSDNGSQLSSLPEALEQPVSWAQWLGLRRRPTETKGREDKEDDNDDAVKPLGSLEASEDFFDAEENSSESSIEMHEDFVDVEDNDMQHHMNLHDVVDTLLATSDIVVEIHMALQSASVQLTLSEVSRLTGSVNLLNLGLRLDQSFTAKIDLRDIFMRQECPHSMTQKILFRQEALDKNLMVIYFCKRDRYKGVPIICVAIQHLSFNFRPSIFNSVMEFFHDTPQVLQTEGTGDEELPKSEDIITCCFDSFITTKRLSAAKRLLYDEYRNAIIDVSIHAPTIIFPTTNIESTKRPVLVAHLGSLKIIAERAQLPQTEIHPYASTTTIVYNSIQRFKVELKEIHVDQLPSSDQIHFNRHHGFSIVDKFAIQIQLDLLMYQEKHMLRQFPTNREGDDPNFEVEEILNNAIDITGDLPEFIANINQEVLDSILAAIELVTIAFSSNNAEHHSILDAAEKTNQQTADSNQIEYEEPQKKFNKETSPSIQKATSLINAAYIRQFSSSKVQEKGLSRYASRSRSHHKQQQQSPTTHPTKIPELATLPEKTGFDVSQQAGIIAPTPPFLKSPQKQRGDAEHEKKSPSRFGMVLSAMLSEQSEETTETWPPTFRAKFTLARCSLLIGCLSLSPPNNNDTAFRIIQLTTDSMSICLAIKPGITSIDFSLGEMSLFKPAEHLLSPYRYLLKTEIQSATCQRQIDHESNENFIGVQLFFANQPWSQQRYCEGATNLIAATFKRYLRIIFQPTPLKDFILFWKTAGSASLTGNESTDYSVPLSNQIDQSKQQKDVSSFLGTTTTTTIQTRDEDLPRMIVNVSVVGVSCSCVEVPSQTVFALCEFESANVTLKLRQYGSDFSCLLKNLHMIDLSAQDGIQRRLFGVIPGAKYLLSVSTLTTDKSAPFFDGYSLDLEVDIGEVEVLCFVGKLMRIFNWIFEGLLDTVTAVPSSSLPQQHLPRKASERLSQAVPKPTHYQSSRSQEKNSSSSSSRKMSPLISHSNLLQQENPGLTQSREENRSAKGIGEIEQVKKAKFFNKGEKVLAKWMIKAAQCRPLLGSLEKEYLEQRLLTTCNKKMSQCLGSDVQSSKKADLIPPLTLRRYTIRLNNPSLIIPVSSADSRHAKLSLKCIKISNEPKLSYEYGLMDTIGIKLEDVKIEEGDKELYLLSGVDIHVKFMRSLLSVCPKSPTWMSFGFSDVPWFITPTQLSLILQIVNQNVLGVDADIINSRKKDGQLLSTSKMHSINNLAASQSALSREISTEMAQTQQDPITITSLYQFQLPRLFVFLTPYRPNGATTCFHADLLQCEISKNSNTSTSILLTTKSARLLHCQSGASALRVFLSNSRQNLNQIYYQELVAMKRQANFVLNKEHFPQDVAAYLPTMVDEQQQDAQSCLVETSSIRQLSNDSEFLSDQFDTNETEDLRCLYKSHRGQKDINIRISDPRLILSRPCIDDLLSLVHSISSLTTITTETSGHVSKFWDIPSKRSINYASETPPIDEDNLMVEEKKTVIDPSQISETSFNVNVELNNASLVIPECIEDVTSPLLIMRGSFQASRAQVTEWIMNPQNIDDNEKQHTQSRQGDNLMGNTNFQAKSNLILSSQSQLSMKQVELFICNLDTLSAIELLEAPSNQRSCSRTLTTETVANSVESDRLTQKKLSEEKTAEVISHDHQEDELSIDKLLNEVKCQFDDSYRRQIPSFEVNSQLRRSLQLRELLNTQSPPTSPQMSAFIQTGLKSSNVSNAKWEDLIRLLCPNIEWVVVVNEKEYFEYNNWDTQTLKQTLDASTRSFVISIQPINVEISYFDVLFLQECANLLLTSTDRTPHLLEASTHQSSRHEQLAQPPQKKSFKTKVDVDIAEMKVLILNDTAGFSSAPFLQISLSHLTLCGSYEGGSTKNNQFLLTIDTAFNLILEFLNPKAVAFEPVIESFRLRIVGSAVTTQMKFNSQWTTKRSIDLHISGSKKESLNINVSNVFINSVVQNIRKLKEGLQVMSFPDSLPTEEQQYDNQHHHRSPEASSIKALSDIPKSPDRKDYFLGHQVAGKFKFTPYSIRNDSGMTLAVLIPNNNDVSTKGKSIDSTLSSTENLLKPGDIHRLTQLEVDLKSTRQASFKVQIELQDPIAHQFYHIDSMIPVERLGVYLYRAIDLSGLSSHTTLSSVGSNTSFSGGKKRSSATSLSRQFLICRVDVLDGQKQLSIQSQVLIRNDLGDSIGLEVIVSLAEDLTQRMDQRPLLLIPPMQTCAVPVYACATATLSFRPVFWSSSKLAGRLATVEYQTFDTSTTPSSVFEWSRDIHLKDVWTRVRVIEDEATKLVNEDTGSSLLFYSSGLPKFLPLQSIKCHFKESKVSDESTEIQHDKIFHMTVVTQWDNCHYRNRQCHQLIITLKPPFTLHSTVPIPVQVQLESSLLSSTNEITSRRMTQKSFGSTASEMALSRLETRRKLSSAAAGTNRSVVLHHQYLKTVTLNFNEELHLFSLPLLEIAKIKLKCFNTIWSDASTIFSRQLPQNSLMTGVGSQQWRKFWIQEGKISTTTEGKVWLLRVTDKEGRSLRLQVILENKMGQPLKIVIHSPVWFVNYVGYNPSLLKDSPLEFAYTCKDFEAPPTPSNSSMYTTEAKHPSRTSQFAAGKSLIASSDVSKMDVNLNDTKQFDFQNLKGENMEDGSHEMEISTTRRHRSSSRRHHYRSPKDKESPRQKLAFFCTNGHVTPLDSEIGTLAILCGLYYESPVISIDDMQTDQYIKIKGALSTQSKQTTSPSEAIAQHTKTFHLCEVTVRIVDCPLQLTRHVKLVTIAHRYLLLNHTTFDLEMKQADTDIRLTIPMEAMMPLEWVDAECPFCFQLKPIGNAYQWGGKVAPELLKYGADFTYHFAPERMSEVAHCNIRIENHLAANSNDRASYGTTILRLRIDSAELPDALQILNHSPFSMSLRQHRTPAHRAFHLETNQILNFGWDDNTLPLNIFFFPDNPYFKKGAVVSVNDLPSGTTEIVKFQETVCQYWLTIRAIRYGCLKQLHLYQFDQTPRLQLQSRLPSPRTPIVPSVSSAKPQSSSQCCSDWSTIKTSDVLHSNRPVLVKMSLSVGLQLPSIYISVISDFPIHHFSMEKNASSQRHLHNKKTIKKSIHRTGLVVPLEFISIYLEDLKSRYIRSPNEDLFGMTITDVQVDNQQPLATFPIILQRLGLSSSTTLRRYETRQLLSGVTLPIDLEKHPLFDFLFKRRFDHLHPQHEVGMGEVADNEYDDQVTDQITNDQIEKKAIYSPTTSSRSTNMHFEIIRLIVLGLIVKADMGFVTAALSTYSTYTKAFIPPQKMISEKKISWHHDVSHNTHGEQMAEDVKNCSFVEIVSGESFNAFIPSTIQFSQLESLQKLYFETFLIHPILLRLSVSPASPVSISSESMSFLGRFVASIGSIQDVPISFSLFKLKDEAKVMSAVLAALRTTFSSQFWRQSYVLVSSVDLLGNPLTTISHLGAGLGDLVSDSVNPLSDPSNNQSVLEGFGKGAKSFWDNTVYGTLNAVAKVSSAASHGLGVLAMDDSYTRQRQQQIGRRKPKDASEGFTFGAEALGQALVGGLRGLVVEPSKGVEEGSLEGFVSGLGKGVVGALVKPVAGVFEATALAAGGIQEAAGEASGVARGRREKRRLPRVFYGPDALIKPYDPIEAKIYDLLTFGLNWSFLVIDAMVYDPGLDYVSIINDDELLTATLTPDPVPDIYCDLWNISECEAVIPNDETLDCTSKSDRFDRTIKDPTRHIKSQMGIDLPDRRRNLGFLGIKLILCDPPMTRYIRTSTRTIALSLTSLINSKLNNIKMT